MEYMRKQVIQAPQESAGHNSRLIRPLTIRRTRDRSCEGFTVLAFIVPRAALGRWEFRLGSDRTQQPG